MRWTLSPTTSRARTRKSASAVGFNERMRLSWSTRTRPTSMLSKASRNWPWPARVWLLRPARSNAIDAARTTKVSNSRSAGRYSSPFALSPRSTAPKTRPPRRNGAASRAWKRRISLAASGEVSSTSHSTARASNQRINPEV